MHNQPHTHNLKVLHVIPKPVTPSTPSTPATTEPSNKTNPIDTLRKERRDSVKLPCKQDGCNKPEYFKGYCMKHRHIPPADELDVCSIPGCTIRAVKGNRRCSIHMLSSHSSSSHSSLQINEDSKHSEAGPVSPMVSQSSSESSQEKTFKEREANKLASTRNVAQATLTRKKAATLKNALAAVSAFSSPAKPSDKTTLKNALAAVSAFTSPVKPSDVVTVPEKKQTGTVPEKKPTVAPPAPTPAVPKPAETAQIGNALVPAESTSAAKQNTVNPLDDPRLLIEVLLCLQDKELCGVSRVSKKWYVIVDQIRDFLEHDDNDDVSQSRMVTEGEGASGSDSSDDDNSTDEEEEEEEGEEDAARPIILDNGTDKFKFGFAGAASEPTHSISYKDLMKPPKTHNLGIYDLDMLDSFLTSKDDGDWTKLEDAWRALYKLLGADPKAHPVLVTIPVESPSFTRDRIMQVMFDKLSVPAIYIAEAPVLAAYSYGLFSGLVIDIGAKCAQVLPIQDGVILDLHVQKAKYLGGRAMDERMLMFLSQEQHLGRFPSHVMGPEERNGIAKKVKEHEGTVGLGSDGFQTALKDTSKEKTYTHFLEKPEAGGASIELQLHQELIKCGEMLFNPSLIQNTTNLLGVHQLAFKVIKDCPIDIRTTLFQNIILSGGGTCLPGFVERLQKEVKILAGPNVASQVQIRVHPGRKFAVWDGGSILSLFPAFSTKWTYKWEHDRSKGANAKDNHDNI
eukprot:g6524.t1